MHVSRGSSPRRSMAPLPASCFHRLSQHRMQIQLTSLLAEPSERARGLELLTGVRPILPRFHRPTTESFCIYLPRTRTRAPRDRHRAATSQGKPQTSGKQCIYDKVTTPVLAVSASQVVAVRPSVSLAGSFSRLGTRAVCELRAGINE